MSLEKERHLSEVARKHGQRLLKEPGVTSVGVGYRIKEGKPTDEMVIQVTVERKLSPEALRAEAIEPLPESIRDDEGNEIPIDVVERSYEPSVEVLEPSAVLDAHRLRRSRSDPIRPGISICNYRGKAGTLGTIVYDADGLPFALSNWHVLQGPEGEIGDKVIQPGAFDGGLVENDVIGTLVKSHLGLAGDCAIASIEGRSYDPAILELDVVPRRIGKANLGDRVVKSGRTTGITYGVVRRVSVTAKIDYGGDVGVVAVGGFEIGPNPDKAAAGGEISMPGDSGSLWLIDDPGDNGDIAVGLHFAGETDPDPNQEHALACNIHSVLQKLGVTLVRPAPSGLALAQLYRALGYELPERPTTEAGIEAAGTDEAPPLGAAEVEALLRRFETDPHGTTAELNDAWGSHYNPGQARVVLVRALAALRNPQAAIAAVRAETALEAVTEIPPDFTFPGMDLAEIDIRPENRQFEAAGDWLRWVLFAGPRFLFSARRADFRSPEKFASVFALDSPPSGEPLRVAVFADFGTGLYHSRYIAKQFRTERYLYLLHLGDVYYAGREKEFEKHIKDPLLPSLAHSRLFMLNSNHEMMSGAKPYFAFIDEVRQSFPGVQQQEASMFCLHSEKFQIVAIDTAYEEHGRFKNPTQPERADIRTWLRNRLVEGRIARRTNILLSADQPYEYGKRGHTALLKKDLDEFVRERLIDLWFWGNTHYCALFGPTAKVPFVGCCVGHGGFPYERKVAGEDIPKGTRLWFLETAPRFPTRPPHFNLRPDMGNNGYCLMELHPDGGIGLEFIDWMRRTRCKVALARAADGLLERTSFFEAPDY